MKVIELNPSQKAEVIKLQAAVTAASLPHQEARKALDAYLKSITGVTTKGLHQRIQVSDDGNSLIIGM